VELIKRICLDLLPDVDRFIMLSGHGPSIFLICLCLGCFILFSWFTLLWVSRNNFFLKKKKTKNKKLGGH
jgi:ABC-type microcin C transport system permease subunit YejE